MLEKETQVSEIAEILLPDIGDFSDIPVVEIYVKAGDRIEADTPLFALESDKATMDVPAPAAGRIVDLLVVVGSKVSKGTPILRLESEAGAPVFKAAASSPPDEGGGRDAAYRPPTTSSIRETEPSLGAAEENAPPVRLVASHASPSVRRLARELGVGIEEIRGSAPKDRVTRQDVLAHVRTHYRKAGQESSSAPAASGSDRPGVDHEKYGTVERVALSRIRRLSGANLARNWSTIPHVTSFDKADITALEELRVNINTRSAKDGNARMTILAFVMKAVAFSLRRHPELNSSLDGDMLVLKQYINIGFAADTAQGLLVPVIRNVEAKGVSELGAEIAVLAEKARRGTLALADTGGGTFTISSLGGIGGTSFTPIIQAPEVALLGLSRSEIQPVWNGTAFEPRLVLPLSLAWDYRVIDGAAAQRFLTLLVSCLENFSRLTL